MCSVSCDHLDSRCASVACLTRFAKCTGTHGLGSVRARGFPTSRNTLWNAAVRAPLPRGHAPPVPRPKDPAGVALPALRDAPPFVYAIWRVGPTIGGEPRLHRPAWSVVISRSPTHQRERHACPPARHLGHCPRSTYAAAAPHLAQPQLKTCSFPRFSCTRKRINLSRTKCELAVVKFDLLMCV
jgi:hypothetical protein